jgi:septal ring-binding cell division protein DamX
MKLDGLQIFGILVLAVLVIVGATQLNRLIEEKGSDTTDTNTQDEAAKRAAAQRRSLTLAVTRPGTYTYIPRPAVITTPRNKINVKRGLLNI